MILFGLSMDYHVFIVSRMRETDDRGMSTEDAVAQGIKATASVVSSAAIVMVAVFAVFATLDQIDFKMVGVGLAAASSSTPQSSVPCWYPRRARRLLRLR